MYLFYLQNILGLTENGAVDWGRGRRAGAVQGRAGAGAGQDRAGQGRGRGRGSVWVSEVGGARAVVLRRMAVSGYCTEVV
jgi:hypothetical protein